MKIPLVEQLKETGFTKEDALAGLTTAIMLIPQAMAYAMLAGLPPIVGLYASTIPLAIYAFLGTSRQLAVGPVAMVSLLVAAGVGPIANGNVAQYVALAALLALMVGVMQLAMGLGRFGFIVEYLSHPVIAGFTSAAALIIGFSQLKHLLGVNIPRSHHVHTIVLEALRRAGEVQLHTLILGVGSVVLLVVFKRWVPRFPRFLFVVGAGTLIVWGFGLDKAGVATVKGVPAGLPPLSLPSLEGAGALMPTAIAIAMVGFMESVSVAKAFARKNGYEISADRELIALGAGNIAAGIFSGYPVTGGFSRTAVNAQAGARTGLSSLASAMVVGVTLLFLTPAFYYLPKAVLAAIIMTAVFGLIDVKEAKHLYRVSKPDLLVMGLTFAATLSLGIELGIGVGVAASLLGFLRRMSRPHLARLGRLPGTTLYRKIERNPQAEELQGVLAVRIDGPLFFANAAYLRAELRAQEKKVVGALRKLIIDASAISGLDASAMAVVQDVIDEYQQRGVEVWFAGVRGPIRDVMERAGLLERVGCARVVQRVHEAALGVEAELCKEKPNNSKSPGSKLGSAVLVASLLLMVPAFARAEVRLDAHAWVEAGATFGETERFELPMIRGRAKLDYDMLQLMVQVDAGDANLRLLDARARVRLDRFALTVGRTKIPAVDSFLEPAPALILPHRALLVELGPRRAVGGLLAYHEDGVLLQTGVFGGGGGFAGRLPPTIVGRAEVDLLSALHLHAGGAWTGRYALESDPKHDRFADLGLTFERSGIKLHLEGLLAHRTVGQGWSSGGTGYAAYRFSAGPLWLQPVVAWDVVDDAGLRQRGMLNLNVFMLSEHVIVSAAYELGLQDGLHHSAVFRLQVGA